MSRNLEMFDMSLKDQGQQVGQVVIFLHGWKYPNKKQYR